MRRSKIFSLGLWLGVAVLSGCSSSKPLGTDASSGGSGASPAECDAPGYHADSAPVTITQVSATVRDASGTAAVDLPVQVCGLDQCFTGRTDSAGKTRVAPGTSLLRPAFKYGDGFEFAELAIELDHVPTQDLGELVALPLPTYAQGAAFPKSGRLKNGDLTLFIESNTRVVHDILTYGDESKLVFRTVAVPLVESALAFPQSFGFELAYALAPLGTTFCPAARLSLENSAGFSAETELEVFVQGLDTSESWAPYGSWVKVAEARVSSDATRIETTSGGIPILSSIAVRRK